MATESIRPTDEDDDIDLDDLEEIALEKEKAPRSPRPVRKLDCGFVIRDEALILADMAEHEKSRPEMPELAKYNFKVYDAWRQAHGPWARKMQKFRLELELCRHYERLNKWHKCDAPLRGGGDGEDQANGTEGS